ncbi:hypothetical protein [Zhongshania sp. BJYM1]|uniref:hypothetical protein n=1 Tax=Zhongshania aquatica TaxID=2965069 RepID=UPI0022B344C4|nr:hypothetical protein [Marortus sp. BJYM1]
MKTNNRETATTQQSDEEQLVTIMSCGFARELGIPLPLELQKKADYYSWNITTLRAYQWAHELFMIWAVPTHSQSQIIATWNTLYRGGPESLIVCDLILRTRFDSDEALKWINATNIDWRGCTPLQVIVNGHSELVRNALVSQAMQEKQLSNDEILASRAASKMPPTLHLIPSPPKPPQHEDAIPWEEWELGCIDEAINDADHAGLDLMIDRHQALSMLTTIAKIEGISGVNPKVIRVDTLIGRRSFTIYDEEYRKQINERLCLALMSEADGHSLYLVASTKGGVMINMLVVQVGVSWAANRSEFGSIGPEHI